MIAADSDRLRDNEGHHNYGEHADSKDEPRLIVARGRDFLEQPYAERQNDLEGECAGRCIDDKVDPTRPDRVVYPTV